MFYICVDFREGEKPKYPEKETVETSHMKLVSPDLVSVYALSVCVARAPGNRFVDCKMNSKIILELSIRKIKKVFVLV